MEHARIVHFEDHACIRETTSRVLSRAGHEIVGWAATLADSYSLIEGLQPGSVDVVIVDGSLDRADPELQDGTAIARRVRELFPDLPIIGFSATDGGVAEVDYNVPKTDRVGLQHVISDLL